MAQSFGLILRLSVALTVASLVLAPSAIAHPHVRIRVEVAIVVENGAVGMVKHRWTFDEDFRRSNFEEYETNRNGILEPDELAPFQQLALETLKRFESFTAVWRGSERIPLKEPVLVKFDMQAVRPTYEFNVALSNPVQVTDAGLIFDVCDPTYLSAFDIPSLEAITIETRDSVCSAVLTLPAPNSAQMKDYRAFVSEFGARAAKSITPRSIKLTCEAVAPSPSNPR